MKITLEKMCKIVVMMASVVAVALAFTGCTAKSRKEQALEYINAKYDDVFVYAGAQGVSTEQDTSMYVSCEKFPDAKISVWYRVDDGDNVEILDNYLAFVYQEETSAVLLKIIKEVYGESALFEYVIYDTSVSNNMSLQDTTCANYLARADSDIKASFFVLEAERSLEEKEETLEAYRLALQNAGVVVSGDITYVTEENWDSAQETFYGNPTLKASQVAENCWYENDETFKWVRSDWR